VRADEVELLVLDPYGNLWSDRAIGLQPLADVLAGLQTVETIEAHGWKIVLICSPEDNVGDMCC
jgi:hypothetical protein